MKITFKQIPAEQEVAKRQVDEAFDILFAEVIKRLREKKLDNSFNNHSFVEGVIIHG